MLSTNTVLIRTVTIISATKCEADNVEELVSRVQASLSGTGIEWDLVFVDDSDDHTPLAIRALADRYPVTMLHRPPGHRTGGLSGALTLGIRNATAPVVVVIDADLQHPPELLPQLLAPLCEREADIVVGSRYVDGGSASGLDGPFRHSVSRAATLLVQGLFPPVRKVKDPVSGYFGLRREVTETADLRPEGFKMLVEILVRGSWDQVVEVPFHFAGRVEGASKVGLRLGVYFLRHVGRLWLETTAPASFRRLGKPNPAHPPGPVLTLDDPAFADRVAP